MDWWIKDNETSKQVNIDMDSYGNELQNSSLQSYSTCDYQQFVYLIVNFRKLTTRFLIKIFVVYFLRSEKMFTVKTENV